MSDRTIEFAGTCRPYSWWSGQTLRGTATHPLSFDTETARMVGARPPLEGETEDDVPIHPLDVPVPALAMVCDSDSLYLIHPSRFDEFVAAHQHQHWVSHNLQFDFWVLFKHTGSALTREFLWRIGDRGGWHDTLVLDLLLQLASGHYRHAGAGPAKVEQKLYSTNLAVLAEEWGCGSLDKTNPYRLRFGELVGLSQEQVEAHPEFEGFVSYALKDVLAVHSIYPRQRAAGVEWMRKAGWSEDPRQRTYEIRPDALEKFGVLTERIQVNSAIVLAELSRTPIRIDLERRDRLEELARQRHRRHLEVLVATEPGLVKRTNPKYRTETEGRGRNKVKRKVLVKEAEVKFTAKAGVPQFDSKKLVAVLKAEAARLGVTVPISKGKERRVSVSTKQWKHLAGEGEGKSEFIRSWVALEEEGKFIEDLRKIAAPLVYSKYDLLKVTGRTGAGQYADGRSGRLLIPSLNIQNVQRDDPHNPDDNLRPLFLPPEGHRWCATDYGYIEFRAMAAVAMALYGKSEMAAVTINHTLRGGPDPHQVTAASVMGVSLEEFFQLDPATQKLRRQEAKIGNFGLMGGMGKKTLVEYARAQGVNLTEKRGMEIKTAWKERYPEMNLYLEDSTDKGLIWGTSEKTPPRLTKAQRYRLSEFLKTTSDTGEGEEFEAEGPGWSEEDRFWSVLEWAAKKKGDAEALRHCRQRRVTQQVRRLIYYRSCTLTGRVRNFTKYTEERNHRFQAISADGAKLAMWTLMRRGFKLLAFVHDELCVALPEETARQQVKEVEKVMVREMEYVLGHGVPVAVDSSVGPCWSKA